MIPKRYKRWAAFAILLCLLIVPGLFWLGGWNFERNETGIGCVIATLVAIGFSTGMIMAVGYENRDS